jgi:hypothetical protein
MSKSIGFGSVLVTGATGIVGFSIVQALHAQGHQVRVLARNLERTRAVVPAGVDVLASDLGDPDSLVRAVAGCDTVFHAAGMPEQWLRDPGQFHRVNVEGTRALVGAALREGIGAFIYTSTIDVFAHRPGVGYDESMLATGPLSTPYERSKQLADQLVAEAVSSGCPHGSFTQRQCSGPPRPGHPASTTSPPSSPPTSFRYCPRAASRSCSLPTSHAVTSRPPRRRWDRATSCATATSHSANSPKPSTALPDHGDRRSCRLRWHALHRERRRRYRASVTARRYCQPVSCTS